MRKRIAYSFILLFILSHSLFAQKTGSSLNDLLYYYNSELGKLEQEIAVEEAEFNATHNMALLVSLNKKKLKREVLNIYGSKAVKQKSYLLRNFVYFSASEIFLTKQRELEENYDVKINVNIVRRTLDQISGLGVKVAPLIGRDETSTNNRYFEITGTFESDSLTYEAKPSEAVASEISSGQVSLKKSFSINEYNNKELALTKFMEELNVFMRSLRVRFDLKNISDLWELRNPDSTITFITPAGLPFTLQLKKLSEVSFSFNDEGSVTKQSEFFADGSLQSFTYDNVKYKRCRSESHKEEFVGYFVDVNSQCNYKLIDSLTKKIGQRQPVVIVHACIENHKLIFKAAKVPLNANIPWPKADHYGLGLYKSVLPVQYENMSGPIVKLSAAALTNTYSADAKNFLDSLNICDRNYIPYAITVANIITKYPKVVSQCYGLRRLIDDFDLPKHLLSVANNVSPGGRDALQQYSDKVIMLIQRAEELQSYASNSAVTDNLTQSLNTPYAVSEFVNNSSNICTLNFLSPAERIRLIKILLTNSSESSQEAIVLLFKTLNLEIADSKTIEFFNALSGPSSSVSGAKSIISAVYDVVSGGDFKEFNKNLCLKFATKAEVLANFFPGTEEGQFSSILYFDDSYLVTDAPVGTHKYSVDLLPNGQIIIHKEIVDYVETTHVHYKLEDYYTYSSHWAVCAPETLDPFTPITIINRSGLSSLKEATDGVDVITAPAFFLKFAAHEQFKNDALRVGAVVADVVTIASGSTLILKAYRAGRFALALYEGAQVVGSLANITVNAMDLSPEERKWVDDFNLIVAAWGGIKGVTNKKLYNVAYYKALSQNVFKGLEKASIQNLINRYTLLKVSLTSKLNNANLSKQIDDVIAYLRGMVRGVNSLDVKAALFRQDAISLVNGFPDNINNVCLQQGITLSIFKSLQQKTLNQLSNSEKIIISNIRNNIPNPTSNTIMQKVIPFNKLEDYTLKGYKPRGFVTISSDAKHLNTFDEIYEGMRLDYKIDDIGTQAFNTTDNGCYVIRFRAKNSSSAIPAVNLPDPSPFPYTNQGLTSGMNGKLGIPEWKIGDVEITEGYIFFKDKTGQENLVAHFDEITGKFVLR